MTHPHQKSSLEQATVTNRRKVEGQINIDFSQHLQQGAISGKDKIEWDSGNEMSL